MVKKIDLADLRAATIAQYRNFPNPTNDPVLAFEARNAELIADLVIVTVTECLERQTDLNVVFQALIAIASIPLDNIISNEGLARGRAARVAAGHLERMLLEDDDDPGVVTDFVTLKRREVGDA